MIWLRAYVAAVLVVGLAIVAALIVLAYVSADGPDDPGLPGWWRRLRQWFQP